MFCARSTIRTGSPMSRTKISPWPPIPPAWTTSATASGVVMKYRVMSGCGDRDGAALLDLPAEDGDDAAGRPEDVAEADRDEARRHVGIVAVGLDDPLAERLALPVDRARVERLVGRDEHEALGRELDGDLRHHLRAEHVVAHRLDRVRLHQRHVLVRGRVEDDLRAVPLEDLAHLRLVLDVADDRDRCRESSARPRARARSRTARAPRGRSARGARRRGGRSGGTARSRSSRRRR